MSYTPLILKILLSFTISSIVLYRYGNWFRHRISVTLTVLLAWFCSFLIIFALPLDIISTVYRQQNHSVIDLKDNSTVEGYNEPWSNLPERVFINLWRTVYWSTQFLTWLIMPMMQSYIKAGDFTIKGKLKSALVDNAIYYGSYLLICGILLIYLALKPGIDLDWNKLKAIASSASNTWGLFLLVLLLGYSLVEAPRNFWNNANSSLKLTQYYFKAAKLSTDKCEAEEAVDDVLECLHAISMGIRPGHYLYDPLETILQKVPVELREKINRRQISEEGRHDSPTEKSLIRLHRQTIKSLQVLQRTETQWNVLLGKIFECEDTLKNQISRDRRFKTTFQKETSWFTEYFYTPVVEWYWKCLISPWCWRFIAVVTGIMSVAIVWSEVTFFSVFPPLSIFAVIVNAAKVNYDYFMIEVLSTLIILYLSFCAYSTVLKIKLLNLYYLAPHHQTNEHSLIFSGMMFSRLTPALCLNFLGLIHMDSHVIHSQTNETSYTQIMGHMDVIGIISHGFNIYFPMAVLVFCLATYFSLGSRFLSLLGFHQFVGDEEMTTDLVEEGRELVTREKRKRQRAEDSSNRRKEFQERVPTNGRARLNDLNDTGRYAQAFERSRIRDSYNLDTYNGTTYTSEDGDRYPSGEDIDDRFGASTGFGRNSHNPDTRFSDGYQSETKRVGVLPPRGIFDDV
ncbi:LMBR1 domain-containing protein 2 homolog [Euwallacea fornicatus]|uniref:LMBR1 domain-containing protein 2 homolog n=1 Tax=Euwallacea fornicatus TaxID=995702 RepID=UPI00338D72F5